MAGRRGLWGRIFGGGEPAPTDENSPPEDSNEAVSSEDVSQEETSPGRMSELEEMMARVLQDRQTPPQQRPGETSYAGLSRQRKDEGSAGG